MNPRAVDHYQDPDEADPAAELTLSGQFHASAPAIADSRPYNLSMYLDFLPGTD